MKKLEGVTTITYRSNETVVLHTRAFPTSTPFGKVRVIFILFCSLHAHLSYAQFVPYSQYANAPVLTNPSQAAVSDFTQLTFRYRRSRVANYEIPSVSFVHPFYRDRTGLRFGGVGADLISQAAGPDGIYKVTGALATAAYVFHLSKRHHVSAGVQGGVINKKLDPSGITTDNQFNLGAYDPSMANGESFRYTSITKPVINAGFSWVLMDSSMQKATLGVAFSNMNRPSYNFISEGNKETVTYTVTGEVQLLQRGRTSIHPTFRYISGVNGFTNLGAQVRYKLGHEQKEIAIGGWYKTTKAVVFAAQFSDKAYILAASMDFSAASDIAVNVNNAFELSIGWRLKRSRKIKHTNSSILNSSPQNTVSPELQVAEEKYQSGEAPIAPDVEVKASDTNASTPAVADFNKITAREEAVLQRRIEFKLGSAELTPQAVQFVVKELMPIVRNHPQHKLHITGHSCTIGDKAVNEKIAMQRAEAISKILLEQGIAKERMVISGMDFQKPIASNESEEGRQKNRRVEFELVSE
jgi:type IX secretion system PorP/SprF family membrane protein